MAHDPHDNPFRPPYGLAQNPAPEQEAGQDFQRKRQALVNDIMRTFLTVLPSNYVAYVNGPWYTLQFQAMAEQLAAIQILAGEITKDSDFDFTRTDFLWEVLGTLVFPAATERGGAPIIDGDTEYRRFLHQMVLLLLEGATPSAVQDGAELLSDSAVELVEKFLSSVQRDPNGAWTIDNQFEIELNVDGFPQGVDPFVFQENLILVVEALKPAHVLCQLAYTFRDSFGDVFDDTNNVTDNGGMSWELDTYYYDDFRKNCYGAKEITGDGDTLADRTLFSDPDVSFASVRVGAELRIFAGDNVGRYRVTDVRAFPVGDDATARAYTTFPTGLAGTATVSGDVISDAAQDWASAVEGEILTFTGGPNAGSYRLDTLLGSGGGPVGFATGPATQVRVSPSILRVERRMNTASVAGQAYTVTVDRLGVRYPRTRTGEDVSEQFYL